LVSGLGAAVADIIYAAIAGFGISIIADFLKEYQMLIRILGGIVLLIVGIIIFRSNPIKQIRQQKAQKRNNVSDFISSFVITFTNPITIVVFGAVFASLGLDQVTNLNPIVLTLLGIFAGALMWWLTLTIFINIFRNKIRLRNLWWINKITGIVVSVFGLAIFVSLLFIN